MKDLLIECCTQFVETWLESYKDMKGHIIGKPKATELLKFCNDYGVYATWKFVKEEPRIDLVFFDADTEDELIEERIPVDTFPWVPFACVQMDRISERQA